MLTSSDFPLRVPLNVFMSRSLAPLPRNPALICDSNENVKLVRFGGLRNAIGNRGGQSSTLLALLKTGTVLKYT